MYAQPDMAKRIRSIRIRLEYTQTHIAQAIGSKLRSWQEWETGNRAPNSRALAGLSHLGVNVNWILTGEGPELIADISTPSDSTPDIDRDLLEDILEVLYDYQDHKGVRWRPDQEAKLVVVVYDYMIEPRSPQNEDRQRTLDLIRTLMAGMDIES